jgi:Fic family protein
MKKSSYSPPCTLTESILKQSIKIAELLGQWDGAARPKPKIKLRKDNQIKSIQSSLAIEGNTLSLEQVTAILEKKRVLGPKKDIQEVQNAIMAYEFLPSLNPKSEKDFLKLHLILMKNLVPNAGKYRSGQVGVMKGSKVSHIAPPAVRIPNLLNDLFIWLNNSAANALLVSCITHYEIEFIHPFTDGNGRMGRLWQNLILMKTYPLFEYVAVEEIVRKNQKKYYQSLELSDKKGDAAPFVEFMLSCILKSLQNTLLSGNFESASSDSRLESARNHFKNERFSRSDYLKFIGQISTATASRDLKNGVNNKVLTASGEKRLALYYFRKIF